MSIEAIIFFGSAFEPLMNYLTGNKVYPQMRTGDETPKEREYIPFLMKNIQIGGGAGGGSGSECL
jgi:hypothetical protein